MRFINRLRHHRAYHYVKVVLGVAAAILAVAVVTSVTVDLGPVARQAAEDLGRNAWKRPVHIGRLSIKLFGGRVIVDDLAIEGLRPSAGKRAPHGGNRQAEGVLRAPAR